MIKYIVVQDRPDESWLVVRQNEKLGETVCSCWDLADAERIAQLLQKDQEEYAPGH